MTVECPYCLRTFPGNATAWCHFMAHHRHEWRCPRCHDEMPRAWRAAHLRLERKIRRAVERLVDELDARPESE